jgi:thymidylate synthase
VTRLVEASKSIKNSNNLLEKLPPLVARINRERRNGKNYVLFLGATDAESNQAPCQSLVQFQIDGSEQVLSAYQRSSDANLTSRLFILHKDKQFQDK